MAFRALVAAAAVLLVGAAPVHAQGVSGLGILALDPVADGNTVLTVSGEGEVRIAPDLALFGAGVTTTGNSAEEAMRANAAKMQTVMAELRRRGIAEADVQTGRVGVSPYTNLELEGDYAYRAFRADRARVREVVSSVEEIDEEAEAEVRIIGYRASNIVSVRLRQVDTYGPLIDALIAAGATNINGPTFALDNPRAALDEARGLAIAEARRRAQLHAASAGLTVQRIIMIDEGRNGGTNRSSGAGGFGFMQAISVDEGYEMATTPSSPGELTITATISVMFELGPN